jgi:hypothetical protein
MAYDLLPISGWSYTFMYEDNDGGTQERTAQLVETDQVWVKLVCRHALLRSVTRCIV